MYRHGKEEIEAVSKVIASGQWFRFGEVRDGHTGQAATLEKEWSAVLGAPYSTFTTSGTSALMMAYAGLGLGPGDEVIVPGYTWLATAHAALALGVIPVMVDVDESLTLDPVAVEKAITPRTRAICPVHMNGLAANLDPLLDIAKRRKIHLIEDACQADGGLWKGGKFLGTLGDAGAFSFNYYKVISCGDGGMFVTRHENVFERAMIYHDAGIGFRAHAKDIKTPIFAGINLRGNEILAAVIRVQLARLPGIVKDLHRVRGGIMKALAKVEGLDFITLNGGASTGTGANLALKFKDGKAAKAFCGRFNSHASREGASASVVLDSGRHVYANWEAVMSKRGASHEAMDPYKHPKNQPQAQSYGKDLLPRTLEILGRSVFVAMNPDWKAGQMEKAAGALRDSVRVGTGAGV